MLRHFSVLVLLAVLIEPSVCRAWSPCIHGVISLTAVEGLTSEQRAACLNLLRRHPGYYELLSPPKGSDPELRDEIVIAQAGMWADRIAGTELDRPNWHFYDGIVRTVGELKTQPSEPPTTLPDDAAIDPKELNLVQAIELCRKSMRDKSLQDAERAVAMCWLINLMGDLHQPLHLGSLYADPMFADSNGDDHGREIVIGGRTLFDCVENFPNRDAGIGDILALKREMELNRDRTFGGPHPARDPTRPDYVDFMLRHRSSHAFAFYLPLEKQIEEQCKAGATSPLTLQGGTLRGMTHAVGFSYMDWASDSLRVMLSRGL